MDKNNQVIRRYQCTAIDDATRIRARRIYPWHGQVYVCGEFIDYVAEKFPFRIHTIRTDNGHEFQARFYWYVEDKGMNHVYIKSSSPQLKGKVERSRRKDHEEVYQLLGYTNDENLNSKVVERKNFYKCSRSHFSCDGKRPTKFLETSYTDCKVDCETLHLGDYNGYGGVVTTVLSILWAQQ